MNVDFTRWDWFNAILVGLLLGIGWGFGTPIGALLFNLLASHL